ncbi:MULTISPECIES: COX15/CtaA family protein [Commensalibacter]|uniref:COX15/CtaA family protein n=1 Tax=Commensalibacter TaxID=1079922 RepID=UPI0012D95E61|nr:MULTISPECIES: COX15/CtaA family protein [Commensalibacter]MCT6842122.1 COX15/CtaA family protein [Commensalibacter sp.]MBH9970128.1 COX15/CtaA family protein [Commensalibacter sp. M0265]MBH9977686.1 COX15/CtaA family protein [Commensalibacter sp. M0266]MBH9993163.1 COX15/CtaA family protein [Commensalibacter sp. M0270]MBI0017166.1 COX15/CtaA family protein [Commensalibacter sp. B14384M2]
MQNNKSISTWLFLICFMLLCMIALGGYTRLTGSGLSIMDWRPITGIIPPLSHAEWVREFDLYKTIPQYQILNNGFGLDGFKQIFWAEWSHRFLGRLIGLVLILPLIWFIYKKMITKQLALRLFIFFILGGLQGGIGWFMVHSGFRANSTAVEPVRLVLHLACAIILYIAILWTALSLRHPVPNPLTQNPAIKFIKTLLRTDFILLLVTIVAGGFTAGTHAGHSFNSFPLMNGHLIPADYNRLSPFWLNWFENISTIQFNHRLLATFTGIMILITVMTGLKSSLDKATKDSFMAMGWAVLIQYALGVTTLLLVVPVWAGTVHQAFAIVLLTTVTIALHHMRKNKSLS